MKVLYLVNSEIGSQLKLLQRGEGHDSHLFGMIRLRKYGIQTDYEEIEKYLPKKLTTFLRKRILTMHYAHLPLFPLFFKHDVVFTSTAYSSLILKAILRIRKFKWVILDFNILGTIGGENTLRQKIFAWAVSKADGIVAISQAEAESLRVRFPHLKDKIIFLHEATDTEYFKPLEGVEEKDVILSVGNYGRDFDTVIKATEGLGVECRLATKLISKDEAKKLPSHVTVKRYTHEEMKRNYAEAKVVVVAISKLDHYYDSVGTFALIESLAMGRATIVSDTRNMHSYVVDSGNALLVPQFEVTAMRTKIKHLLDNPEERFNLGSNAREWAVAYVSPEQFASHLAKYLKSI